LTRAELFNTGNPQGDPPVIELSSLLQHKGNLELSKAFNNFLLGSPFKETQLPLLTPFDWQKEKKTLALAFQPKKLDNTSKDLMKAQLFG